jgi:glycosidase
MMEFHISRIARDRYKFDQSLFSYNGNAIFANFHASRVFSQKLNEKLDLINYPEQAVKAGQINAMGLIDEIFHHVINLYRRRFNPKVFLVALVHLETKLGISQIDSLLKSFVDHFPPISVYNKELSAEDYLSRQTDGISNRALALEELVLLFTANRNPALAPYQTLFNDQLLSKNTIYRQAMDGLHGFFETQPKFGPDHENLIDMLHSPAKAEPYSLNAQLEYIRKRWSELLGQFLYRLLSSLDLLREDEKISFVGAGPTLIPILSSTGLENEPERFSPDSEWMPRLVLIAKNTYVWMDQLSKKYQKAITKLNQIPDEDLRILADRGFSGLWLIGLWERSRASAKIKQLCGNPDAISSAYSLYSYEIASDLGGEQAYQDLRDRASRQGIRLASDMVPNHMGIDSPWLADHPEWFLSLDECPYPSHSFNGPNLSSDGRIGIYLEDHYFDRTDAAVEFKRVDYFSGQTKYVYHGNDGTSMPWNDTAQLNYLNPATREAVIQTILSVARKFPIIRFDAAMTLAKKHFQRLWFPEPGTGGAIPSRSEHALTRAEFDRLLPMEFWREVVDRVATEVPDTLLLAEAFWMMEGYFVRTLGMHRVYNSAFMNMLRNEDNAGYRSLIKNTLEFDPQILERYVNFMNNPDERTAIEQFGKGDKYFGICTVMSTLPGLPMFGHGQIEGFSEKYGMEFRKALWEESIDENLVERHNREIFPLLKKRSLFSGAEHFLLYDFHTDHNQLNDDVYAYSNHHDNDKSLVIFHNKFAETSGWIKLSTPFVIKSSKKKRRLIQRSLSEFLEVKDEPDHFVLFRDQSSNLEFIRPSQELVSKGMFLKLAAYQYHVFTGFNDIKDDAWHSYRQLCEYLDGRGVPCIQDAFHQLFFAPIQKPFQEICNSGYFAFLMENRVSAQGKITINKQLLEESSCKMTEFLKGISQITDLQFQSNLVNSTVAALETILTLQVLDKRFPMPISNKYLKSIAGITKELPGTNSRWFILLLFPFLYHIGKLQSNLNHQNQTLSWLEEWQLGKIIEQAFENEGMKKAEAEKNLLLLKITISIQDWFESNRYQTLSSIVKQLLSLSEIRQYLQINRHKDVLWFNKERFTELLWWLKTIAIVSEAAKTSLSSSAVVETSIAVDQTLRRLKKAADHSDYRIEQLLVNLQ